jgi:hypothetical protein
MHMRMFRVAGGCRHLFERHVNQPFQIASIAEASGYDQLLEPLIARFGLAFEPFRNVNGFSAIEGTPETRPYVVTSNLWFAKTL